MKFSLFAAVLGATFVSACATSRTLATHPADLAPEQALLELKEGNARYIEGKPLAPEIDAHRRHDLANEQHPFAIVLSCSDSRVPPEYLFNQGLGDLFVVRVAGNVVDKVELGSLEYAAEHLHSHLLLVLGHQSCGAVKASIEGTSPEGNIGCIVEQISPAVATAKQGGQSGDPLVLAAVTENVRRVAGRLTEKSEVLKHLVESGQLKIAAGVYDMKSGKVDFLELAAAPSPAEHHP